MVDLIYFVLTLIPKDRMASGVNDSVHFKL